LWLNAQPPGRNVLVAQRAYIENSWMGDGANAQENCYILHSRLHGHNYVVEVVLAAEQLDAVGFVVDYGELKPLKQVIDSELDHRHLNDVLPGATTAEAIARFLFDRARALWPQTVVVRVSETPTTWAEYRP
jgi:6-pyruvoyltetrahydropterin/6-carboxytetrahydropterin synthase